MKRLIAICGVVAVCLVAGLGFMLARKSRAALDPGILTAQVNTLAAGWESRNIPATDRVVNLIISDVQAPLPPPGGDENSGSRSVLDSDTLSIADEPPVWKRAGIWFKRTFLRRTMSAGEDGGLAEAFPNIPSAVWTHKGFETASEEEMALELEEAVIKAGEAGAEVNIITQGISAAPVLKAIRKLEGVSRKGKNIAVNKLAALDMNKPTLQKIDPAYFGRFKRPGNLNEWVNIWRPPSPPHRATIELFSQSHNGSRFYADELFPEMGLRIINPPQPKATAAEPEMLKFVQALIKQSAVIEESIDYLAQAARTGAQQEKAAILARELADRAYKTEMAAAAPRPASQPQDSLSAIGGGWLKKETVKIKKITWRGAVDYCKKKGGRLPTVNELKNMHNAECVGGRSGNTCDYRYWSSDVKSAGNAWAVDFYDGSAGGSLKNGYNAVRCASSVASRK